MVPKVLPEIKTLKAKLERGAVRVEPPGENPVVEVSYDGQEVLISRSFYDH